jgi:uncharacterized protein (TIGR02271 family)
MTVRVGVIGTGIMGADHISTLHRHVSGAAVTMVADLDLTRARAVAAGLPGARATDDGFALIADPAVDAVVGADQAMTRSEEELRIGTETRERGRVRLRKYVTTEQEQVTVPVQREEVRVEREPVTDANVAAATSGPELTESEHEVVLREERPVVEKEVVPRERVRLDKDTVTGEEQIGEEVRKEQIEVDEGGTDVRDDRRP